MKWITPFAFVDDAGALHLCCDKVCKDLGLPLTEENLRIAEHELIELMKKVRPDIPVQSNVGRHLREHPERIVKE